MNLLNQATFTQPVPASGSRPFSIRQVRGTVDNAVMDQIAIEEPLEIRIVFDDQGVQQDRAISITMRTPGCDEKLAVGFLVNEGIVTHRDDVFAVRGCRNGSVVRVQVRDGVAVNLRHLQRHFYTSSSCGVCGKASIDAVSVQIRTPLQPAAPILRNELIGRLPQLLREVQSLFDQTGGLHASALFNSDGDLLAIEEDVGRHNALDKVIGGQWLADASVFADAILMVSGRISFELVQKALVVGIPILVAVGAPSSLAIELAQRHDMTLIGFAKADRYNVYSGAQRITTSRDRQGADDDPTSRDRQGADDDPTSRDRQGADDDPTSRDRQGADDDYCRGHRRNNPEVSDVSKLSAP